jgi:hypothetical protein
MAEEDAGIGALRWVGLLPIALTVAGLLLYGSLTIATSHFYEQLNTSADDVGLGYVNTLTKSAGFVLILVVIILPPILWAAVLRRSDRTMIAMAAELVSSEQ